MAGDKKTPYLGGCGVKRFYSNAPARPGAHVPLTYGQRDRQANSAGGLAERPSPKTDSFRWRSERATMAADFKTGSIDWS
jgi:hypothetical protein